MTTRFWTTNSAYRLVGPAILGILVFSSVPAFSQDGPQSESGMRLAQAVPVQQPESQPIWGVNCTGTLEGLDCRAEQVVQMTGSASVTVGVRPGATKPVMTIVVPSGINLTHGVTLQFGQDQAKRVALRTCDGTGCAAEYAITDAEIAALTGGQSLLVSVQPIQGKPISVQVPATGFATAYAKSK
jgi:invasion protein IalB